MVDHLSGLRPEPDPARHSFVSLLSDSGVPIENIARLVGHAGRSEVTETVYRLQPALFRFPTC